MTLIFKHCLKHKHGDLKSYLKRFLIKSFFSILKEIYNEGCSLHIFWFYKNNLI